MTNKFIGLMTEQKIMLLYTLSTSITYYLYNNNRPNMPSDGQIQKELWKLIGSSEFNTGLYSSASENLILEAIKNFKEQHPKKRN